MTHIDNFYLKKEEPQKGCLLVLRKIILEQNINITETQKWGMPCFCYKKIVFCYLWIDKKTEEPYILLVDGKYLKYVELEEGNRSKMKILRVNPNKDIAIDIIKVILNDALNLCKNRKLNA